MKPDITQYYETPCRFRLNSGKVVFGVIWRDGKENKERHYFASSVEYRNYKRARQQHDWATCNQLGVPVNIDDVIAAEILEDLQRN